MLEDSSGNGGAAVAVYAAAGGMRATIMAPEFDEFGQDVADAGARGGARAGAGNAPGYGGGGDPARGKRVLRQP